MSQLLSKTSSLLVALMLGSLPGAAVAGTCGVLPFSAGDDVNRGAAPNITALVSSELDIRGGYDLVIAAPPEDFEGGDCGASTTCIKEFGRANKHEAVVAGSVVTDGDEYLLTVKVHDANNANVLRQVKRKVPTSALDLADAVTDVVIELVTGEAPSEDEDGAASASSGPLFDDVDFDELLDEAEEESARPAKKKRSRAAPRNPDRDEEMDLDDEAGDDPFGIDELDTLDMSADQIEKQKRDRERQAEAERARKEEEERIARARAEEERQRRIAEEREREERARARAEREEREREARAEAERREERERQERIREEREREERERARAAREAREREEAERQARADREERERRDRAQMERERREREESERVARADRDRRSRDDQEQREREERERRARERAAEEADDGGDELVLGSALALGPASGIIIGGDDDDDEGGFSIGPADDDEDDYDDYEVEDDEPREGMIIGDNDERENPNVRRRREATESRDEDDSSDRYSRARTFGGGSSASSSDGYRRAVDDEDRRRYDEEDDADLDDLDDEDRAYARDDARGDDRDYSDRSYEERSYGSEPVASRDDAYLSDDYDDRGSRSYRASGAGTRAKSKVSRSDTGWGNRPYFSARLGGGYTNYYLHFAQYGVDLGIFPVPRVSVDLQADFWTLSIRECPECEQQYRTLPSFYLGGSYRFTNLKFVQPYVGGDVGTVVYAIGTLTAEDGTITRRPLMGAAFAVKGGADFMFTKHFGISAGVKAGVAYASKIKENVHPDWNPLQFLVNVRIAAVVQF